MSYDNMFQKAIELQNTGALNQAEDIYLQLLQVMPENSDVWNLLGLVAQSKGNLTHAVDCFLNAIKYAPTPFFAHFFNLGLVYKSLNKPKEATEAMERSVALKNDFKEGWNFLGVLQAEAGLRNDALKSFCKALDIDKNYDDAMVNLCYYTNDLSSIIKLANENKSNFQAQLLAAQISENNEDKKKYLQRAIESEPNRVEPLLKMAELLRYEENINGSLTYYHKTLNLDENNVEAILGIADCYLCLNDLDKAEKFYLKSFDLNREIAGAHLNYGTLLYRQKRTNEALEEYRKAVTLDAEKPEISYNLALILKETGDIEEALGLMFNAHLKAPENEMFIINIAETLALFYEKNPEAALKIAENWQKQEPDNVFSKRIFAALSGVSEADDNLTYTEKLFDHFAETYEQTLEKLQPAIIKKLKELGKKFKGNILDLGCGTGLAAEALSNKDNSFDGVDLSAKMIEIAQNKKIYKNLYHQDILSFLKEHPARNYDWVLAADVFCYLGDLKPVLKKLTQTNMCFSVEAGDEDRHQNYYLTASGRYKHKKSYILSLLSELKFANIKVIDLTIRQENGKDVAGYIFYSD